MAQMKYIYELTISSSPHAHAHATTRTVMRDVLIALAPALAGSVYFFGFRALMMTLISVASCVFFEWSYRKVLKLDSTVWDLSAVITGVLLAFVCPVTLPYWCIVAGAFFAIIIVKQLFGGIGQNFVNPALAARAFLLSWPLQMTTWVVPGFEHAVDIHTTTDAVTGATPLAAMHQGAMPSDSLSDMFFGRVGGCLGETSALLLLIGLIYLLIRRVITLRIPLSFLGTVAVLTVLFPMGNPCLEWMGAQLLSGGLLLGAIFMATDYVTSPVTKLGQIIFGIGCGALTVVIRYFGGYNEGVSYAVLVMNCCVVMLDRIGRPRKFGSAKKGGAKG